MTEKEIMKEALITKSAPVYSRERIKELLCREVASEPEIIDEFIKEELEPKYKIIDFIYRKPL